MKKTKTGKSNLVGANELNAKNGKFRVNMFVDLDVVDAIRKKAEASAMPYQTLINRVLREYVQGKPLELEQRLAKVEKMLEIRMR